MAPRFSLGQVETGKENLDALPPADKDMREVGLRDAIRLLAPTIRKLDVKGYFPTENRRAAARAGHHDQPLHPQGVPPREGKQASEGWRRRGRRADKRHAACERAAERSTEARQRPRRWRSGTAPAAADGAQLTLSAFD